MYWLPRTCRPHWGIASRADLIIGCGKGMTPGGFFTGLIGDVQIYNSAVKP